MTWSPSDTEVFRFLGSVPRWVWILLLIITVLLRIWLLVAISLGLLLIFVVFTFLGFIAFEEIIDDDGPGHKGNKSGIWEWLKR